MKKKLDAITLISIIIIILTWLGVFMAMLDSGSCLDIYAKILTDFGQVFSSRVYAKPSLGTNVVPLYGPYTVIANSIELLAYIWCVVLITYPIIKFIRLIVKKKDFTENEMYESKKKEIKSVLIRNIILSFLIFLPAYIIGVAQNLSGGLM